jgi:type IV secretion system protein TrbD
MIEEIPIRNTGHSSSKLLKGCDRELFFLSAGISLFLVFYVGSWPVAGFGVVFWLFIVWVLRLMGKKDPQMRDKYKRTLVYRQTFYPARATHFYVNKNKKSYG